MFVCGVDTLEENHMWHIDHVCVPNQATDCRPDALTALFGLYMHALQHQIVSSACMQRNMAAKMTTPAIDKYD